MKLKKHEFASIVTLIICQQGEAYKSSVPNFSSLDIGYLKYDKSSKEIRGKTESNIVNREI